MDLLEKGYGKDPAMIASTLRAWGRKYPHAGYGGRFGAWLRDDRLGPYQSYGNGAAMRISAVGWYADNEADVKAFSHAITGVTHDSEDGFIAAETTAMAIFYLRKGKDKEFLRKYAEQYYDLPESREAILAYYEHIHSEHSACRNTMPEAFFSFLTSTDFEDCLRGTIALGGDSDTLAAIACSIAEPFYSSVPPILSEAVRNAFRQDPEALGLIDRWARRR
jgi:ADP-ribosylglycohydrolase